MSEDNINLNIKCSNADRAEVISPSNCTISELKVIIDAKCNISALQQRLIYKGKVLKDELTLESYDIKNGDTIHLVKGVIPAGSVPVPNSTASTINPSLSTTPTTNSNPMQNMMNNMGGGMNMNNIQQQMMQNPSMMSEMMNSPIMESMMSNPEMMQNMMQSNPQLQALMDSNPQIRQMLNDPAVRKIRNIYLFTFYILILFIISI
jgi:ubiquilin